MKKVFKYAILAMCVSMPLAGHADFWKKLGKGIDKVTKTVDDAANALGATPSNSNNRAQASGLNGIPNISMSLVSVQRWGDDVRIEYAMTNSNNQDVEVSFSVTEKYTAFTDNLGTLYNRLNFEKSSVKIPASITIKDVVYVKNVNPQATSFDSFKIGGEYYFANQKWSRFAYATTDVPISDIKNTNSENVTCTLPTLFASLNGIEHQGSTAIINFSIRNDANTDLDSYNSVKIVGYSADGNELDCNVYRGTEQRPSWINILPAGVTMNFRLVVNNVSPGEKVSLIRLTFLNNKYKIEFRNITL